jgi:hypothetical protein
MIILDLLPTNTEEAGCALALMRRLYASKWFILVKTKISKLSTKDLLALASMKNVAKREM